MEENLTAEPTIVESSVVDTGGATPDVNNSQVQDIDATNAGSTVVETPTPMDNNVTYNNVDQADTQHNFTYDDNQDPTQNMIRNVVNVVRDENVQENNTAGITNFLENQYDYDHSEAGSYWVAGGINDVQNQLGFLQAIINEEMYDELDLQKYYYDTNLATARAYAAQKKKEVAYGFYRAAQEKALSEGQLTGWYMPAEGRYMLGQYTVAQNILESGEGTADEIAKAKRVSNTVERWFKANQIGPRGIKCLGMMQYEETVRHNKANEELQRQANAISGGGAAAQAHLFDFQVEEMELQSGQDWNGDNKIGHPAGKYKGLDALRGYNSQEEALTQDMRVYSDVLTATSSEYLNTMLGDKAEQTYKEYQAWRQYELKEAELNDKGYITADSLSKESSKIALDDTSKIKSGDKTYNKSDTDGFLYVFNEKNAEGKVETRVYVKDKESDTFIQVTDPNLKLSNDKTIKDQYGDYFVTTPLKDSDGKNIQIGADLSRAGSKNNYTTKNFTGVGFGSHMNETQRAALDTYLGQGWTIADGVMETQGSNTSLTLMKEVTDENGNKTIQYASIDNNGKLNTSVGEKDVIDIHIDSETREATFQYPNVKSANKDVSKWYTQIAENKMSRMLGAGYEIGTFDTTTLTPEQLEQLKGVTGPLSPIIKQEGTATLCVQFNSDGTPVYTLQFKKGGDSYFIPKSIAESNGTLNSDLYNNFDDVITEHNNMKKGIDYTKPSTTTTKTTTPTDTDNDNNNNKTNTPASIDANSNPRSVTNTNNPDSNLGKLKETLAKKYKIDLSDSPVLESLSTTNPQFVNELWKIIGGGK